MLLNLLVLIAGLVLFLGAHSVRIVADDWRSARLAAWSEGRWKGLYSLVSLAGLVLTVIGYGMARATPLDLWQPPVFTRHLASLLMLVSFILMAAVYVPGTRIRARLGHPMVLSVKTWALAHLLANGRLADVLLFGSFLAWAVLDFRAARARDRRDAVVRPAGPVSRDALAVVIGVAGWLVFALMLHAWLIGVQPFA
jgi:uncharacterized membrane protein